MSVPTEKDITIMPMSDQGNIIYFSQELFQAQGEWELLSLKYSKDTLFRAIEFDQLIYQVQSTGYMKCKPI